MKIITMFLVTLTIFSATAFASFEAMTDDGGNLFWQDSDGRSGSCMTDSAGNVFCD